MHACLLDVQVVPRLRGVLPVVVEGEFWEDTAEELDDIFVGDAEVWWVTYPCNRTDHIVAVGVCVCRQRLA